MKFELQTFYPNWIKSDLVSKFYVFKSPFTPKLKSFWSYPKLTFGTNFSGDVKREDVLVADIGHRQWRRIPYSDLKIEGVWINRPYYPMSSGTPGKCNMCDVFGNYMGDPIFNIKNLKLRFDSPDESKPHILRMSVITDMSDEEYLKQLVTESNLEFEGLEE